MAIAIFSTIASNSLHAWSFSPMSEARKEFVRQGLATANTARQAKTTCTWSLFTPLPKGSIHACGISLGKNHTTLRIRKANKLRFETVR